MSESKYNTILSLLFIIIARQYSGFAICWLFFALAIIFFLRVLTFSARESLKKDYVRSDINSLPPSLPKDRVIHKKINN